MKVNKQINEIVQQEFNKLLEYHIKKLTQLIKLEKDQAYKLKYMVHAIKGSRASFIASNQSISDIKECISTIKMGQENAKAPSTLLPIQVEIIDEMDLFLLRYNIK